MHDQQSNGLFSVVSRLGDALGIAAAIFLMPLVYDLGKRAALGYLTQHFGAEFGKYLMWVTGAIEAYVIYAIVKALVSFALSWAMTVLVARKLGEY